MEKHEKGYPYSYIECNDSVAVLGIYNDKFVFIRQYRHSIKKSMLEIPGGALEQSEEPIVAAKREMLEETGYEIIRMNSLGVFYPTVGSSNERCFLFFGECENRTEQCLEPLEEVEVVLLSGSEIEKLIKENSLQHSMALISWLRYKLLYGEARYVN